MYAPVSDPADEVAYFESTKPGLGVDARLPVGTPKRSTHSAVRVPDELGS
jgi:hypothetical protein